MQINYEWWRVDGKDVRQVHVEALQKNAKEHIFQQLKKGLIEGTLADNRRLDKEDYCAGVFYRGYWSIE